MPHPDHHPQRAGNSYSGGYWLPDIVYGAKYEQGKGMSLPEITISVTAIEARVLKNRADEAS
ncbi:hypothetical protein ACWD9K_35775 [Streptomyces sp. 900116325]|uniref:hypothetical protein n=1 Tax=Streptomyces sp. NPDC000133 TaxID=3364535 RepID=UPI0036AFB9F6